MSDEYVSIDGLVPLLSKITTLVELRQVRGVLLQAARDIRADVKTYPPLTAANRPGRMTIYGRGTSKVRMGPMGWYERGAGWRSPSGRLGTVSETLGKKWAITTENSGMTVTIGNNASYAPLVQDEGNQTQRMRMYGWKTIQTVLRENIEPTNRYIMQHVQAILEGK